jgi:hypothetical protein
MCIVTMACIPHAYTTNGDVVKRVLLILGCFALVLSACGGADGAGTNDTASGQVDQPSNTGGDGESASDDVVNRQPSGRGYASVDGVEYTFDTPGGQDCRVAADDFGFSYIIGDNEVVFGGGASVSGGQWFGTITLRVFADNNVTTYTALVVDNPDGIAIDGDSVSYSGPMEKTAPNPDGSVGDPVDVGEGVFSSTC